jgi:hypothetical protein
MREPRRFPDRRASPGGVAAALGWLFTADGDLDMATKDQDTLASGAWDSAGGGPGARGMIAAFAERQWRLREMLSYSGIEAIEAGCDGCTAHPEGGAA